jgi:hypothetical protein
MFVSLRHGRAAVDDVSAGVRSLSVCVKKNLILRVGWLASILYLRSVFNMIFGRNALDQDEGF